MKKKHKPEPSPVEKIEQLCKELSQHYGEGDDKELRIAAKLMIVAVDQFRQHGGVGWSSLAQQYLNIAVHEPEKFNAIVQSNRGDKDLAEAFSPIQH